MPPKQAKGGNRNKNDDTQQEEPLQAVLVADSFENKFSPFTTEKPRCLLPLVNTPLIEYTLEYLARSGVQDVYFYASSHIDQVETYLNASKWMLGSPPFSINFMRCGAGSIGDIMRDIDNKGHIKGDFIFIQGDVVSDFPIQHALKAHKLRREKDKNAIMTMCLRERGESGYQNSNQIVQTFVIDPMKDRCLHYEETRAGASFVSHLEPELLEQPELDFHQDLVDCRIDVCSLDVLGLWSDNFDTQQPRKDFLNGILKDHELNGKTIHTYIIEDHYASRVEDASAYARITYDLQHGVASSLLPSNNIFGTKFTRLRGNIVKEDDVIIQRPAKLRNGTIIGEDGSIGAGTTIENSVIGRRVQIGKKTMIESAFIWDDVTVGSNVKITRAVIGSESFIGDGCVIEEGAFVAYKANVPAGKHVLSGQKITTASKFDAQADDLDSDNAFISDDEIDADWAKTFYKQSSFNTSHSSLASDASNESDGTDDKSDGGSRSTSFATHTSDEDDNGERFIHDTSGIVSTRMAEGQAVSDIQSELLGLRFSANADSTEVFKAVASAFSKYLNHEVTAGKSAQPLAEKTVERYRDIIWRPGTQMTMEDQVVFLLAAQRDLGKRSEGAKIMPWFFMTLFQQDVFKEETFETWFEDEGASEDEKMVAMKTAAKPFMDWLEAADEESSEEEEGEDEDEEESDA